MDIFETDITDLEYPLGLEKTAEETPNLEEKGNELVTSDDVIETENELLSTCQKPSEQNGHVFNSHPLDDLAEDACESLDRLFEQNSNNLLTGDADSQKPSDVSENVGIANTSQSNVAHNDDDGDTAPNPSPTKGENNNDSRETDAINEKKVTFSGKEDGKEEEIDNFLENLGIIRTCKASNVVNQHAGKSTEELHNLLETQREEILVLKHYIWRYSQALRLPSMGPMNGYVQALVGDLASKAVFLANRVRNEDDILTLIHKPESIDPPIATPSTPEETVTPLPLRKRRGRPPKLKPGSRKTQPVSPDYSPKRRGRPPKSSYPIINNNPREELSDVPPAEKYIKTETVAPSFETDVDGFRPMGEKLRRSRRSTSYVYDADEIDDTPSEEDDTEELIEEDNDKIKHVAQQVMQAALQQPSRRPQPHLRPVRNQSRMSSPYYNHKRPRTIRHVCKICHAEFYHGRPFNKHLIEHSEIAPMCCIICKVEFSNEALCMHHKCKAPPPPLPPKPCPICDKNFPDQSSLVVHCKEQHGGDSTMCLQCGKFCGSEKLLSEHIQQVHSNKYICNQCGYTTDRVHQFNAHVEGHKRYKCEICEQEFQYHKWLQEHRAKEHDLSPVPNPEKSKQVCTVCDKVLGSRSKLILHFRLHTGEKPIECKICNLHFRTPKAMNKHRRTYIHMSRAGEIAPDELEKRRRQRKQVGDGEPEQYDCTLCSKTFPRKGALQKHMNYHTGEKPFLCPHCGFTCREYGNLKEHIKLHFSNERNIVCELCGATFHTKKALKDHCLYRHNDERNFICELCPMTFKTRNALSGHAVVHSNLRKHKCPQCELGFNRRYHLRRHLRVVHGSDEVLPLSKKVQVLDIPEGLDEIGSDIKLADSLPSAKYALKVGTVKNPPQRKQKVEAMKRENSTPSTCDPMQQVESAMDIDDGMRPMGEEDVGESWSGLLSGNPPVSYADQSVSPQHHHHHPHQVPLMPQMLSHMLPNVLGGYCAADPGMAMSSKSFSQAPDVNMPPLMHHDGRLVDGRLVGVPFPTVLNPSNYPLYQQPSPSD